MIFVIVRVYFWMSKAYTLCRHGLIKQLVFCRRCLAEDQSELVKLLRVDPRSFRGKGPGVAKFACEHHVERRKCKICHGSDICAHGKNNVYCRECDGRRLCQVCFEHTQPRCYSVCRRCRRAEAAEAEAERLKRRATQRIALCI